MPVTVEQIREALEEVKFPGLSRDIVSYGFVDSIEIEGGVVHLKLALPSGKRSAVEEIAREAHAAASAVEGVEEVKLEVSAPQASGAGGGQAGGLGMARKGGGPQGGAGPPAGGPGGPAGPPGAPGGRPGPTVDRTPIPGVRQMIAVASGKGGVGKSTVAVNLAAALAELGEKVGLMDADIYGPSVPTMLGTHEEPRLAEIDGERKIVPVEKFGMRLMSLGFIQQGDDAVIWRGPLVMKAVQQFLRDVDWRGCEVLVIDLPPGTGDAQLTLTQTAPLTGAIIVTTPQDVALIDARKGLKMFNTVDVPVLGIVENMSYFRCPECGHESHIFKSGGGERTARELGVPFLGGVPIDPLVAESGDEGIPIVTSHPDSDVGRSFLRLAETVREEWPEQESGEPEEGPEDEKGGMAAALDRIRGK